MNRRIIVLALSIALNGVLLVLLGLRTGTIHVHRVEGSITIDIPGPATPTAAAAPATIPLPAEAARNLAVGQAISRLSGTLAKIQPNAPADPRYWRNAAYLKNPFTPEQRAQILAAQAEFAQGIRNATGDNVSPKTVMDSRRSFLTPEKLDKVIAIEDAYDNAVATINEGLNGLRLPSDEAKLKALLEARDRGLAALLTPEELEEIAIRRPGSTAGSVRAQIAPAVETEEDYKKIYALQKVFDEKYPGTSSATLGVPVLEAMRLRREAEPQLIEQIHAALGDEKFDAIVAATDQDRRNLQALAQRVTLPPDATDKALALRTRAAQQSQQVYANQELSAAEKKAQVVTLGEQAKSDLVALLGPEAGPSYSTRAVWLRYLSQGAPIAASVKEVPVGYPGAPFGFNTVPLSSLTGLESVR